MTVHSLFSARFLHRCSGLFAGYLFISAISAQVREPTEFELKAALLYNFALFTEWPTRSESIFNLCLYGQDPFGVAIQVLTQKSIRDRPIRVQHLNQLTDIDTCHLLYIHSLESSQFNQLLMLIQGKPVLTVTDIPMHHNHSGIINLEVEQKKIRFDIDLLAANRAGLSLSSKLLRLARRVHQ
ncbi:MAG: YfiR family protein [Gammaproteobacteria bacterium]|nr:YfiR family protein [Gammaproteobacteria bacterium]